MSGPRPDGTSDPFLGPFRPPSEARALSFLAEGRDDARRGPRELNERWRRNRILRGALSVFGRKGFARATVQDLIDEVGISRATFYKYFADREACLVALNDELLTWLEAEAKAAIDSVDDWPSQVRAATERLVGLVSGDPRIARVCGIEATLVSDQIRARRAGCVDSLTAALRAGRAYSRWGEVLPAALEDLLVGGAISLATQSAVAGRGEPRPGFESEIAELMLLPYLGVARARKLVRGA